MSCFACFGGGADAGKKGRKKGKRGGKQLKLVLVGLDGAGKSTLLQTILGDAPEKTLPTFGFNNESTHRAGFDIDLYDLGGGKRIRGIWKAYLADVHGCIFVVDSADEDRIAECREVFAETLRDPHLSGKPIVVFANKQDLPEAKSAAEVAEGLGLSTMQNARHHIVACTALRATRHDDADTNVDLGMRWMLEKVGEDWDELNPRVAAESEAAREKEEALKRERVKRGEQARRERLEAEASAAAAAADAKEDAKADVKAEAPGTPAQGEADESSTPIGGSASPTSLSPLKPLGPGADAGGAFGSPLDPAPPGGVWTPAPEEPRV